MNDGTGWGDRQIGHDATWLDVLATVALAVGIVWLLIRWGGF